MDQPSGEPDLLVEVIALGPILLIWGSILYFGESTFRRIGAPISDYLAREVPVPLGADFGPWLVVLAIWTLTLPLMSVFHQWVRRHVTTVVDRWRRR